MQPYTDAAIFARTTGYLNQRHADIGSRVKAGQLLAEIDTPEIDQQLLQARADLATAKANAKLAQTTAERYRDLIKSDSVSRQDLDNANGSYDAQEGGGAVGDGQRRNGSSSCRSSRPSTRRSTASSRRATPTSAR